MRRLIITTLFLSLGLLANGNLFAQAPSVTSLIKQLETGTEENQANAAHALGEMGVSAKEAVPALIEVVKSGSVVSKSEAITALGKIGPAAAPAIPELAKILRSYSIILKYNALEALRHIGPASLPAAKQIAPLLESNNSHLKLAAAWAIATVDPTNKETLDQAITILLEGLDVPRDEVRADAATALSQIGAPAVEPLLSKLKAVHSADRHSDCETICDVIAQMGIRGQAAIPTLIQIVKKVDDPKLVWHAAHALGRIHAKPDEVVPALIPLLANESADVRAHAAIALGDFGPAAKAAVPGLTKLLADPKPEVKIDAAAALADIGPAAASAVPQLATAMQAGPVALTLTSASALAAIGEPAVPELTKMVEKDSPVKLLAIKVLGEIGASAKDAIPALAKLIISTDPEVSQAAITTLGDIGPEALKVEPELLTLLQTGKDRSRNAAAYALSKMGSKKAIPLFQKYAASDKEDERFRLVCAWALLRENPTDAATVTAALPGLIDVLADENPLVRREAANAISLAGPLGAPAVPALLKALNAEKDPRVAAEFISALAEIGPASAPAVPVLQTRLDSDDPELRMLATYALAKIGPKALGVVPYLEKELATSTGIEHTVTLWALTKIDPTPERALLAAPGMLTVIIEHPSPNARLEAAISLGELGVDTPEIRSALEMATKDEDPRVRVAAAAALKKLGT